MGKEFDLSNVKTCVNADDVCIGDYGYFADDIEFLRMEVVCTTRPETIKKIRSESCEHRFVVKDGDVYNMIANSLFYPLEGAK